MKKPIQPPAAWLRIDGSVVSCTESVKVLEENWHEAAELLSESYGETLQVSFIGYNSKDVMVGAGENHIKVQLREDTQKLDEVVVVGYGTQIKRAVTGSVQSIKSEEMADMPVAQISQKMQG